jgi:hypothetical protein
LISASVAKTYLQIPYFAVVADGPGPPLGGVLLAEHSVVFGTVVRLASITQ